MNLPGGARDLVLSSVVIITLSRFVEGPLSWAIGGLLLGAAFLGGLQVLADADPAADTAGVPIESLISPATAAFAGFGAIRLVPIGILLIPALVAIAALMLRLVATEARLARAAGPPSGADRTEVLVEALVTGFIAFVGMAALVPAGLPEPGSTGAAAGAVVATGSDLALLAAADALVAFLLGYRVAALRSSNVRDVAWSAASSAAVIAIAAAILRALEIPRALGPALLVLVFFLWDTIHGAPPSRRRDPRRIWETALLVALGGFVIVWSLSRRA